MNVTRNRLFALSIVVLFMLIVVPLIPLIAQDNSIIVSLSVPEYLSDAFSDKVLQQFEGENPGVKVHMVESGDEAFVSPAAFGIDDHLDGMGKYVATADVVYVNSFNFSVEATRAGYFLDLMPLINVDSTFDTNDFIPSVWQSYQWDGGVWAMPLAASVQILAYKPKAFDAAGLPYPTDSWTLDDLMNAARTLAVKDENGSVTVPGYFSFGNNMTLLRALYGQGFYDGSTLPNVPLFTNPTLEDLLTQWAEFEKEGVTGRNLNFDSFDFNKVPLRIEQSFILSQPLSDEDDEWAGTLLPGGAAGLSVEGFSISAGTQVPEQAYELVKFLSSNADVVNRFFSDTPARKSLIGVESEDSVGFFFTRTPEVEALIQQAVDKAIPVSEMRFSDYVSKALDKIENEGVDANSALQEVEADAVSNVQTAEDKRDRLVVSVATAVPTPVLSGGEVSLNFGLASFVSPLPNREKWDEVIADFTANDPQVRQVVFDSGFGISLGQMAEKYDCFYLPYSAVQNESDLSPILPLDPYMSADPDFDEDDIIGNTLTQLQKGDQTWGYPAVIQPLVLRYNKDLFDRAGVALSENGWTIDQFRDALQQLKLNPDDPAPFVSNGFGGTHLFILIAAYGGLPLDFRTDPVSVNLTDPANVEAIRQVLDLAREGYIKYEKLGDFSGGGGGGSVMEIPVLTEVLSQFSFFAGGPVQEDGNTQEDPYLLTTYPTGNQFTGAAYDIGSMYISVSSQNPDPCYRWISTVAQHPDLFSSMPVRRSQLSDPELNVSQGKDLSSVYNLIDVLLQDPNTISMPSQFGGGSPGNFVIQLWLYRAFDSYVLEDSDLDAKLSEAQIFSEAYIGCIADIPSNTLGPDASPRELLEYFRQFTDCATKVDPGLKSLFNF